VTTATPAGTAPSGATPYGVTIDGGQLMARLSELAMVTATLGRGVTRLAYSPEDVQGRDLVAGWMHEAGLLTHVDAAGNLIGRRSACADHGPAGPDPVHPGHGHGGVEQGSTGLPVGVIAIGSHLDSVVEAGPLDGAYGAVAAVQVAAALNSAGVHLRHDLVVIGFSNEEGARGTPGMVGSLAITGRISPDHLAVPDDEGVRLADRISGSGGDPDRIDAAAWPPHTVAGFLELHVEQGPVLADARDTIGVVSAVTARSTVDVTVTGAANHAGTTPMASRRDAALAAAQVVLAVRDLGAQVRVATTGVVRVEPGVRNVVAGRALVGVDLRDTDDAKVAAAIESLRERAARIGAETGCELLVEPRSGVPAVPCDPLLADCVWQAAANLGLPTQALPSGAGHDAQVMAVLGPMAMIFVPSVEGVSHAPGEFTEPAHLISGAEVLLGALLLADARLSTDQ
jgi:allantoate deiminase